MFKYNSRNSEAKNLLLSSMTVTIEQNVESLSRDSILQMAQRFEI